MRDDIINVLKNSDKALTIYELQEKLDLKDVKKVKELSDELRKMEEEVIIYCSNKGRYMMLEDSHLRKGVLRANKKGFGFVEIENMEDDVYIASENMNGAIHGDIVLVEITSKMNLDRLEGRILKILKRQVDSYIGEINFDSKGLGHITLDDSKIKLDITTIIKTIFDHWLNMAKIIAIPNNKKLKKVKRFFAIIFKTLLPFVLFNLLTLPSRVNFVTSSLLSPVLK